MVSRLPPIAPIAADSESLFRAYVETANDMVYTVDLSGRLTFINPYGERLLGCGPEDWLGQPYMDFVAPQSQLPTAQAFENLMRTGELIDYEFTLINRQGREIQMQVNGRLLFCNGELIGGLGIARDITDRKRFEQQLRTFVRALESIHDSVIVADLNGHILYANPATERLFARGLGVHPATEPKEGSSLDTTAYLSEFYPESGQAAWLIDRAIAGGWSGEAICQRFGGECFPSLVSVGAVPGEDGQPQAVSIICRDITDQKQAQARLAAQNIELERASRLKSEFLANMSHELRTPLTSILGFSGMLNRQIYGPLNKKQAVYVQQIHTSGKHLLELINDVLDLSKVEAGQIELSIAPIDVAALCEETLGLIEQQANDRQLRLHRSIDPDLETLWADPLRVRQMLLNLLSNAIKFSHDNGQIWLSVWRESGYLYISVRDEGIGIPNEARRLLFQPFQQLDTSLSRRHQGTGLGLALTRQLVELHGGTVDYDSVLGQGSCFTISLPTHWRGQAAVRTQPESTPTALTVTGTSSATAPLVLVVEDDPNHAKLLQDFVTGWGYRVAIAPSGCQALDWLSDCQPDTILLDLQLPDLSGFELFRRLRQNPTWVDIPVIAATAMAMASDRDRCFAVGMQGYLSKPIDDRALADLLQRYAGPPNPVNHDPNPDPASALGHESFAK